MWIFNIACHHDLSETGAPGFTKTDTKGFQYTKQRYFYGQSLPFKQQLQACIEKQPLIKAIEHFTVFHQTIHPPKARYCLCRKLLNGPVYETKLAETKHQIRSLTMASIDALFSHKRKRSFNEKLNGALLQ